MVGIVLVIFQGLLLGITLFLLWNIIRYLRSKPPGHQTLLDGAYIHLFEYLGLLNLIFTIIATTFELSDHQVNPIAAQLICWFLLTAQQLFYYQLLICAVIRLFLVLNYQIPTDLSDTFIARINRICVIILSLAVTFTVALDLDFQHPFASVMEGESTFQSKIRVGPILACLSLMVQFTSRLMVSLKIGSSNENGSKEIVNSQTFVVIFLYTSLCHLAINLFKTNDFQIKFTIGHGGFLVVALQVLYHSDSLRKHMKFKFPKLNKISPMGTHEPMIDLKTVV